MLATEVSFRPKLTHFLLVRLEYAASGQLLAYPERAGGSGDLASLLSSNAFLELAPEQEVFLAGSVLPAWQFR